MPTLRSKDLHTGLHQNSGYVSRELTPFLAPGIAGIQAGAAVMKLIQLFWDEQKVPGF